jgi:transposase
MEKRLPFFFIGFLHWNARGSIKYPWSLPHLQKERRNMKTSTKVSAKVQAILEDKVGRIYIGVDFHKMTCTLCITDFFGAEKDTVTVDTDQLLEFLEKYRGAEIAIETTGGSNHIVAQLVSKGHKATLVNTNRTKAIGQGGQKNDNKDAEVLSDLLRSDYLPRVHLKSLLSREVKTILVQRELLVQTRVSVICHVRGILREFGITIEVGPKNFYKFVGKAVKDITNEVIRKDLEENIEMILKLKFREVEIEKALREQCMKSHPEFFAKVQRLETVPGIGGITAMLMVAILDDVTRFPDAQKWGSYLGLTPKEFSSGEMKKMGSITRSGCEMLRRYLIHGARSSMKVAQFRTPKSTIDNWALKKKKKLGMNKATVALAHKLARIGFAIIRDNKTFSPVYLKEVA